MPQTEFDWRWLLTDNDGIGITLLDHLASDRLITPKLNQPLEISGTAPSDNSEVNRLHTDGYPFLAEGVRQLYCFRRESDDASVDPNWVIRASGLVLQVNDAAASDDARTRFTAWDPWQYLFYVPARGNFGEGECVIPNPDGGYEFPAGTRGDEVITFLIDCQRAQAQAGVPAAAALLFLDYGLIQPTYPLLDGYTIQAGASIGDVLTELCGFAFLDIVFRPIYDVGRPGILCEMDVLSHKSPSLGAGAYNWSAIFAWDRPGRSATGMDDLFDGTQRANIIQYYNGPGGDPVATQINATSVGIFGEFWSQRFFPSQLDTAAPVLAIAQEELLLRGVTKQTLTVDPASGRAPRPLLDYGLGDRVPVYASDRLRQPIPPTPASAERFQRVYEIPIAIDDNGVETVSQLVVGPAEPAPPVAPLAELGSGQGAASSAAINAAQRRARQNTQVNLAGVRR